MGLRERIVDYRVRELQGKNVRHREVRRDYEVVETTPKGNDVVRIYNPDLILTNQHALMLVNMFPVIHAFEWGYEGTLPRSLVKRNPDGKGFITLDGNHRSVIADLYGRPEAIEYFVAKSRDDKIICPRSSEEQLRGSNGLIRSSWGKEWSGGTSRELRERYSFLKDVPAAKEYFESLGICFDGDLKS